MCESLCSHLLWFQAVGPASSSAGTRGKLSAPALWGTSCSQSSPVKVNVLLREPLPPLDTQAGPCAQLGALFVGELAQDQLSRHPQPRLSVRRM